MKGKIHIHFWWHFHQPLYRLGEKAILPWVKLHACRDYLDMGRIIGRVPGAHVTFNFTPVLLEQLQECIADDFFNTFARPFKELSIEDKVFLLKNCFYINWRTFIYSNPRFSELLSLRGTNPNENEILRQAELWNRGKIDDLRFYFLLSWCGETIRSDERIQTLMKKSRNFVHEELLLLMNVMQEYCRQIIPLYIGLKDEGKIALTTTPYYHPILPILVSPESLAREHPGLDVPPISADLNGAQSHIAFARDYHQFVFSYPPDGLWPAEGAVSEEMLGLLKGFPLIGTDETMLHASEAEIADPAFLYVHKSLENACLAFRDKELSNRIGFIYGGMQVDDAVSDFIRFVESRYGKGVVHIILDGENAWGGYIGLGRNFLEKLYKACDERFSLVHAREVLEAGERKKLSRLHSGSWIDGNFRIWIGDPVKNHAWLLIEEAKQVFKHAQREQESASFLAAQGSDWFWWYGEGNQSPYEPQFDQLFRQHLKNAYLEFGISPPVHLDEIFAETSIITDKWPTKMIHPVINGKIDSYFEWEGSGRFVDKGDSMVGETSPFKEMYYGFDREKLYIRLDPIATVNAQESFRDIEINVSFHTPKDALIGKQEMSVVIGKIIEMAIPFTAFDGKPQKDVSFHIFMKKDGLILYRYPKAGLLSLTLPGEHFEEEMWSV